MKCIKKYWCAFMLTAWVFSSCATSKKLGANENNEISSVESSALKKKYSTILNVSDEEIKSVQLYSLIDEWYGTKYKYGGCDKNGIDCSNFVGVLYNQVYRQPLVGSSASILDQCKLISKSDLKEGDLVFFKIDNKKISHIGMYLQNNKFVHATTKKGVMIDDLSEPYYTKHFYKAGRLK